MCRFPDAKGVYRPIFNTTYASVFDPDMFDDPYERDEILDERLDLVVVLWSSDPDDLVEYGGLKESDCMVTLVVDLAGSDTPTDRGRGRATFFRIHSLAYVECAVLKMDADIAAAVAGIRNEFSVRRRRLPSRQMRERPHNWWERVGLLAITARLHAEKLIAVPEVALERVLDLDQPTAAGTPAWEAAGLGRSDLTYLKRTRADLVICTEGPFALPVAIVEWDGDHTGRKAQDGVRDEACRKAGLAIARFRWSFASDIEQLRQFAHCAEALAPALVAQARADRVRHHVLDFVFRKSNELPPDVQFVAEDLRSLARELQWRTDRLKEDLDARDKALTAERAAHAETLAQAWQPPEPDPYECDPLADEYYTEYARQLDELAALDAVARIEQGGQVRFADVGLRLEYAEVATDERTRSLTLTVLPGRELAAVRGPEPLLRLAAPFGWLEYKGPGAQTVHEAYRLAVKNDLKAHAARQLEEGAHTIAKQHAAGFEAVLAQRSAERRKQAWDTASLDQRADIISARIGLNRARQAVARSVDDAEAALKAATPLMFQRALDWLDSVRPEDLTQRIEADAAEFRREILGGCTAADKTTLLEWVAGERAGALQDVESLGKLKSAAAQVLASSASLQAYVDDTQRLRTTRPNARRVWETWDRMIVETSTADAQSALAAELQRDESEIATAGSETLVRVGAWPLPGQPR